MKNSGVEWIGEIPDDWEVKRLKFVINKLEKGSGISKDEVVEDGDTPCLRYGEIYTKYADSFEKCFSKTKKNLIPIKKYFSKGDILFTGTGELIDEIGKNIVYMGEDECLAGGDIIIAKHSQNPRFLNYALNSSYAQAQKSQNKSKLKVVHISAYELGNINFILPPKETQQKIATYLESKCSKIAETIQNQQQVIENLKTYKQSLITEAVIGKIKIQNGKVSGKYEKYKKSGIDWIEIIPDTWCVCKIKYICTMQAGKTLSSEMISEKGLYPVYGGNGKRGFYTEYNTEGKYILIGRQGALCGNVHLVNGKFWATEHAVVTTPNKDIDINYLFYLLSSMNLNQYVSSTAAQPGLSVSTIINLKTIIIKSIDYQKSIVDYLDKKCVAINNAIQKKQELIEKLTEYKKSLIYECVTGKKEV